MAKYKIHFTDDYGQGTIECDTIEGYRDIMHSLTNDPCAEDIWVEQYNEEEGYWEA